MIRRTVQRILVLILVLIVVLSPFFLFRDNGRLAPLVLVVWLLLAVTYVFAQRKG